MQSLVFAAILSACLQVPMHPSQLRSSPTMETFDLETAELPMITVETSLTGVLGHVDWVRRNEQSFVFSHLDSREEIFSQIIQRTTDQMHAAIERHQQLRIAGTTAGISEIISHFLATDEPAFEPVSTLENGDMTFAAVLLLNGDEAGQEFMLTYDGQNTRFFVSQASQTGSFVELRDFFAEMLDDVYVSSVAREVTCCITCGSDGQCCCTGSASCSKTDRKVSCTDENGDKTACNCSASNCSCAAAIELAPISD